MERSLSEQGNARTFASSQDAKLYYQTQDLEILPYLIENEELKIGRFTLKAKDDILYILLDDQIIFKLDAKKLLVKRLGNVCITPGKIK